MNLPAYWPDEISYFQVGVRNGMFVGNALKLCPDLITIPYDFDGYKSTSQQLYDTIARYVLLLFSSVNRLLCKSV
jgi:nucleotidyltransferase/DNA polymerase involved in DNA repair